MRSATRTLGVLGLAALLAGACYSAPNLLGPYRCDEAGGCADPAMVCDDGLCCNPTGAPRCRSYVLDGGTCASGDEPGRFFLDQDHDGYGNDGTGRLYCAPPVMDPYIARGGDCDDANPNVHPEAKEECDGLDNECDGEADNGPGMVRNTHYEDLDNDGYGSGAPRLFCAPPKGFVGNQSDCGPSDPSRHPGAPERCNGEDDNCDGQTDEPPVEGMGEVCTPVEGIGELGECRYGVKTCLGGRPVCVPNLPLVDLCDGLDNDCDGELDERPDCGGPADLFAPLPELTRGAQNVGTALNGGYGYSTCVKDFDGGTGETWAAPVWASTGSYSHVFWVETSKSWDLSRDGTRIQLAFDYALSFGSPTQPWAQHGQPVVYLCGRQSSSLMRFVHFPDDGGTSSPLMEGSSGSASTRFPLGGDPTWRIGLNTNLDLHHVKRIEMLVQPGANTTAPAFQIHWVGGLDGGTGFLSPPGFP